MNNLFLKFYILFFLTIITINSSINEEKQTNYKISILSLINKQNLIIAPLLPLLFWRPTRKVAILFISLFSANYFFNKKSQYLQNTPHTSLN